MRPTLGRSGRWSSSPTTRAAWTARRTIRDGHLGICIHRSMGTHISKVKSIDLDIWTPEQMASIQKWGNKRANAYWEAHLKAGHVPPDHKIESFIRSKYETRRWAKEGAPPSDPSVLDEGGAAPASAPATAPAAGSSTSPKPARAAPGPAIDLLSDPAEVPAAAPRAASTPAPVSASAAQPAPAPPKPATGGGGGLFDLDWSDSAATSTTSPTSPTVGGARGKSDILSLFAQKPPVATSPPVQNAGNQSAFGGLDAFGGLSMGGTPAPAPAAGASNPWASPPAAAQSNNTFGSSSNDIWGSTVSSNSTAAPSTSGAAAQKKDAFSDIWGDFK
ncbi:Predicted GTPase-activating protein [Ceraceosorus bombacis]|uniref:Predicted GTPase-activating protein n=1 Tax=Ceraceosorus bombacis TaxID=401625 RepID=A0A0P1BPG7_9BASI|nr:Predicted GTPase-activating protein [Ceraceosorus bombacis]